MKKYVFEEYRDKAGVGSEKIFDTKKEAVMFAESEWKFLTENDKASYLNDANGTFRVYEVEISQEQAEDEDLMLSELWSADVWDALSEGR